MATLTELKKKLKKKKFKILVTGAAGFIGSNLVEFLLNSNQNVIGLDNLSTGNLRNLSRLDSKLKKKFKFIKGDIRNYKTCLNSCRNVDFILHNAALGSVPRSIKDPLNSHNTNSTGFLNVLHSANVSRVKKLIFASSSSVYGDYKKKIKVENFTGKLLSPYAVTKKNNEDYAEVFAKIYKMKLIGLRYFNVFGINQNPYGPYSAVIPRWIDLLIKKKTIEIYGDGKNIRDYCFIDNVIQANILAIIENNKENYQIYNVAAGKETNLKNLYKKISKYFFLKKISISYKKFRIGDVKNSVASIKKIKNKLDYKNIFDIDNGLIKLRDQLYKK